ncbi:Aste57867_18168 [Aphanomyces stellatus]|uniref:Aste57867_18168 protein n=1 Tax=Aphanomyces stellatus TaxID=120398 RepID=A0A485LA10_9STRA|nr:hypothetical protein As57867_018106 [Aphanomyces stellatus]VFT94906.1 Aste57867_18168 [Aphanomyces stellatus]
MTCTVVGFLAMFIAAAGIALSGASAGLPLWSMLGQTNNGELAAASFTSGVWGYCTDLSFSNTGTKLNLNFSAPVPTNGHSQCFLYYSSNKNIRVMNNTIVLPEQGACTTFQQDGTSATRLMGTITGLDVATFDDFLTKTCGVKGKLSLAFAMLSPVFGVLGLLMLVLGVCCSKNRSCLVSFALFMNVLAGVWALVVCVVWSQQQPAGGALTFGISYYLGIAGLVCYFTASFFLSVHMTQGRSKEEKNKGKVPVKLQEALEKAKKTHAANNHPTRLV